MSSNSTIGWDTSSQSGTELLSFSEPNSSPVSSSTDVLLTSSSTLIPEQGSLTSLPTGSDTYTHTYHSSSSTFDDNMYSSFSGSSTYTLVSSSIDSLSSGQNTESTQYDSTTTSYSIITPSLSMLSSAPSTLSTLPMSISSPSTLSPPSTLSSTSSLTISLSLSSSLSSSSSPSSSPASTYSNSEELSLESASATFSSSITTAISPSYTALFSIFTTSSQISMTSQTTSISFTPSTTSSDDIRFSIFDQGTSILTDTYSSLPLSATDSSLTDKPSKLNSSDSSTFSVASKTTTSIPTLISIISSSSAPSSNRIPSGGTKSTYLSPSASNVTYSSQLMISTSSSDVPLTTSSLTTTTVATPSTSTSNPAYNMGPISSSGDSKTIYYFYTQAYDITGSSTTFATGLPTTIALAKSAATSFLAPSSTITADMSFYQHWLDGSLDNNQNQGTSKSNTGTIVGSVVGGVGGILVCALVVWFILFKKRKAKRAFKESDSFSHEIGRRTGFPTTAQAKETSLHAQESGAQQGSIENASTSNPFSNEFNFKARGVPPVPLPRNGMTINNFSQNMRNDAMNTENRFSYGSSFTYSSLGSSTQGGFSTLSSNSIRLGHGLDNNASNDGRNPSQNNSEGFLREII
ncbi:hypothetical protein SKDZ_14G1470 [Saccharomyces kudriavzevii ZP591]|nr:hypothetical protein SKDZ_14G1470 [Saccharomyces kudriavzevii ZP591]